MTAVAAAALLAVVAAGVYVTTGTMPRRHVVREVAFDCSPIIRMIDEAFEDGRMTEAETHAMEEASAAMRARATAGDADAVARCVGLPQGSSKR